MSKKFTINGREYESYELSNSDLIYLINSDSTSEEDKEFLKNKVIERFTYDLCPKSGEDSDDVFARFFGNFVNGKCHSMKKVAERMSCEHRYLQNEMFKVCMAYIKKLAENCEKGYYDPRNQYACNTAKIIINALDEKNWAY